MASGCFDVRRLLLGEPGARPRVIVVEELRWIDPPSEAFLKGLVEVLPSTPTLLVASFRPEYRGGWLRALNYAALPLQPLDERSLAALLREQLGTDPSLAPLAESTLDRVGGNPFFVEELIRHLVESGRLEGERGALQAAGPIDEAALPATVQAALAARIDRLIERDKTVCRPPRDRARVHRAAAEASDRAQRPGAARGAASAGQGHLLYLARRPQPGTRSSTILPRRSPTGRS